MNAILAKYAAASKHIKLQTMDPELNPGWTKQYDPAGQGLATGTLVVSVGTKYKNIGVYDMYNYDYSNYDPTNPNSQPQITSLSAEQRVTSALQYVTAEKNVTLYVLEGQGEQTLDSLGISSSVSNENYAVKPLSFLTEKAVPAEADMVLVLGPKSDLTAEDAEKLRSYLAGGGRAVIVFDVLERENALPNFAGILKSFGVEVRNVMVIEGDQSRIAAQNPFYVIPNLEYHDILSPLRTNNYDIVMVGAQAIQTLDLKKKSLKIEPLLTSSSDSWGRRDIANNRGFEKLSGDLPGPFALAVAITDPATDASAQDTKLVVVGNVSFLAEAITSQVPGNGDFFMNSLGWLKGQKESISIRAKSLQQFRLSLNTFQSLLFSGIVVILMPLLVLGAGFVIWMRRRHL